MWSTEKKRIFNKVQLISSQSFKAFQNKYKSDWSKSNTLPKHTLWRTKHGLPLLQCAAFTFAFPCHVFETVKYTGKVERNAAQRVSVNQP